MMTPQQHFSDSSSTNPSQNWTPLVWRSGSRPSAGSSTIYLSRSTVTCWLAWVSLRISWLFSLVVWWSCSASCWMTKSCWSASFFIIVCRSSTPRSCWSAGWMIAPSRCGKTGLLRSSPFLLVIVWEGLIQMHSHPLLLSFVTLCD